MEDDGNTINVKSLRTFLILYLFLVIPDCGFSQPAAQYVWKTGIWGECKHFTCGKGGKQMRTVWCEHKSGLATQEKYCQHIAKPSETRNCFKVCEEHRDKVRWSVFIWSECQLAPGEEKCSRGKGVQTRTVFCVWKHTGFTENDDVCSMFELKPLSERACELRCPQDCILSEYSSWSTCDNCQILNRTRTRTIVVPPLYGGRPCSTFSEMLSCSNCTQLYFLSLGSWNLCSSFKTKLPNVKHMHSLIGHQSRKVMCRKHIGTMVNWKYCLNKEDLMPGLAHNQVCMIPQNCELTEWSAWKVVNSSCVASNGKLRPGFLKRQRSVVKIPLGTGQPCDRLEELIEVHGSTVQECPVYKWQVIGWSRCEQAPGVQQCSVGIQHGRAVCIEENYEGHEKPVANSFCDGLQPLTTKLCTFTCDWDCTVSKWTEWSECLVKDCEQYARRRRNNEGTGQRYRSREVITSPGEGGMKCPYLSETQSCDPEPCFKWVNTRGPCMLLNTKIGDVCGIGVAYRTIGCENKHGLRVSDSLCEELKKRPEGTEQCCVPCPNDCVLSEWALWSMCPDLCQEGRPRPNIRTKQRQILAFAGPEGVKCPPNRDLEEVQECPTVIECAIFVWQTDHWGTCELEDLSKPCGIGTERREIGCYNLNGQLVSDERCYRKLRPETTRSCDLPCPQSCVLTEFTDWSPCSAICWEATHVVPIQTREAFVLQYEKNGGSPCHEQLLEVRQCLELPLCEAFYWEHSEWSDCVLAPHVPFCGQGLRGRNVVCRNDNRTIQTVDVCIKYVGPMPPVAEACYVSCDHECLFTEWSTWSLCVGGCQGHQFRTRRLIDERIAHYRCRDHQTYPLDERQACVCNELHPVVIGNWSDCIVEEHRNGGLMEGNADRPLTSNKGLDTSCGPGMRYKVIACRNNGNNIESADQCLVSEYEEEKCIMDCPTDCVMSEWTVWSQCSVTCGVGVQMRYRHARQYPHSGGRQCPDLDTTGKETHTKLCWVDCMLLKWWTYEWSVCISVGGHCGDGTQTRTVRCEAVDMNGYTSHVVDDVQCSRDLQPQSAQSCYLACAGECVVSQWSKWTACDQPCDMNQIQEQRRTVLREPQSYSTFSTRCPPLLEEKVCVKGDNCLEYTWSMSDWTSCLVNSGLNECGIGHKERYVICRNHLQDIVSKHLCEKALGPVSQPLVISCDVPCDADCLLSAWSPWSTCSRQCGLGVKLRQRTVLQNQKGNGRKCPLSLAQSKPCFLSGCYEWVITNWSVCTTQKGACGVGIQQRNMTCVGSDGLPVNPAQCSSNFNSIIMSMERTCRHPCPGECVISDWSTWNECFVSCQDFNIGHLRGVQSRSRAILANASPLNVEQCPNQLWESRPCQASTCYKFEWAMTPWRKGHRDVWCQRTDGLKTFDGCDVTEKPTSVLACNPECLIINSLCNDTNTCTCKDGYYSEYDIMFNNILISCNMDNSSISTPEPKTVYLPESGKHSFWMYAVVAVGTIFVIFVAVALYNMSELFRSGPRPRTVHSQVADSAVSNAFACPHKAGELIGEQCMKCNLTTGNLEVHKRLPHGLDTVDACSVSNDEMFLKHFKKPKSVCANIFPAENARYLPEHECLLYSQTQTKNSNSLDLQDSIKYKAFISSYLKMRHSDSCLQSKPSSSIVHTYSDSAISVWTRSTPNSKQTSNDSTPNTSELCPCHTRQPSRCSTVSAASQILNKNTKLFEGHCTDTFLDITDGTKSLENFMHDYLSKIDDLSSNLSPSKKISGTSTLPNKMSGVDRDEPQISFANISGPCDDTCLFRNNVMPAEKCNPVPDFSTALQKVSRPTDLSMPDETLLLSHILSHNQSTPVKSKSITEKTIPTVINSHYQDCCELYKLKSLDSDTTCHCCGRKLHVPPPTSNIISTKSVSVDMPSTDSLSWDNYEANNEHVTLDMDDLSIVGADYQNDFDLSDVESDNKNLSGGLKLNISAEERDNQKNMLENLENSDSVLVSSNMKPETARTGEASNRDTPFIDVNYKDTSAENRAANMSQQEEITLQNEEIAPPVIMLQNVQIAPHVPLLTVSHEGSPTFSQRS